MAKGKLAYYYRGIDESIYYDISSQISEHVKGSDKLNDLPGLFNFGIKVPRDSEGGIFDLQRGDEVVICRDSTRTEVLVAGFVSDPGRQMIAWDKVNDQPLFKYNVNCVQSDFSSPELITQEFTQANINDIFSFLFDNYCIGNLGGGGFLKYYSYIGNYQLDSYKPEKRTLREALTDLCIQIKAFWIKQYGIIPDADTVLRLYPYIEIHPNSGSVPVDNSSWVEGVNNNSTRWGKIANPIIINRDIYSKIVAEEKPDVTEDPSVIQNWIELNCNIFSNNDSSTLSRWSENAQRNTFEYDLKQIAFDIENILITEERERYTLAGSTDTIIKVETKAAQGITSGDKLIFPDRSDITAYSIQTVTEIDEDITTLTLSAALAFTPAENEKIEICENVTIYPDNQSAYEDTGATIDIDLDRYAKIRFLNFSEPPPGMKIIVLFIKCQPYTARAKNMASIQNEAIGVRRRDFSIDNDIILTRTEADNLASYFLITEPQKQFKVLSRRYEKPALGLSIPINISGWLQENFILHQNDWIYLGNREIQSQPAMRMLLTFQNEVKSHEQLLMAFNRKRRTTKTAQIKDYTTQQEKISVSENISVTLTNEASREILLFTSNIDGKFDIYILVPGTGVIYQLTDASNSSGINFYAPSLNYDGTKIIAAGTAAAYYDIYTIDIDLTNLTPAGSAVTQITTTGYIADPIASKLDNKIYFVQHNGTPALYYISGYAVDSARTILTGTAPAYWGNASPMLNNDETLLYYETDYTAGSDIKFNLMAYRFSDLYL